MKARFDRFVLDTRARRLVSDGQDLHLSPKAFDLLVLLIEHRPAVVEKLAIREHLWPGVHVVDASLSNLVSEIRSLIDERSASASLIRTVHGVGYAFGDEVDVVTSARRASAIRPSACWVLVNDRPVALMPGENVIGRDAGCAVWIDSSGVSRRHARIDLGEAGEATVEDLGSTNGTYVRGRRLAARTDLRNGDRIRVGDVTLVFRTPGGTDAPTKRVSPRKTSP